MELWFSIAQNIGQNKIEKPEMRKILMKTKELSALEVSASSSHLFSKNQKNAFCMKKNSIFLMNGHPKLTFLDNLGMV